MDDGHGTTIGSLTAGFFYTGDRPGRWKDHGNIWLHGYWAYDWANSYEKVAELDTAHRFLRTEAPYGHYGFGKGQRFYFLNILEELDEPGEWFVDSRLVSSISGLLDRLIQVRYFSPCWNSP